MCCGMFSSIPDLYLLDAPLVAPTPSLTAKNVSRPCSVSSRARLPEVRTTDIVGAQERACLPNPETKQNATRVPHSFSCSASSSCCLVGNGQQVMATGTPGGMHQTQRQPPWHSPNTALLSCCSFGPISGLSSPNTVRTGTSLAHSGSHLLKTFLGIFSCWEHSISH